MENKNIFKLMDTTESMIEKANVEYTFKFIGTCNSTDDLPDPKDYNIGDIMMCNSTNEIFCIIDNSKPSWIVIEDGTDNTERDNTLIEISECKACGAKSYKMLSKYRYQCEYCGSIINLTY